MIKVDKRESRVCSTDENESKSVIINACYLYKSESKSVHISVNTSEVINSTNGKKDEEYLVTDNSVIDVPSYFMPLMNKCAWQLRRKIRIHM